MSGKSEQALRDHDALLENDNSAPINLVLSSEEALVLFELLSRYGDDEELKLIDSSEQIVLWNLLALLEKQLTSPFRPDYETLLHKARQSLVDDAGIAR